MPGTTCKICQQSLGLVVLKMPAVLQIALVKIIMGAVGVHFIRFRCAENYAIQDYCRHDCDGALLHLHLSKDKAHLYTVTKCYKQFKQLHQLGSTGVVSTQH